MSVRRNLKTDQISQRSLPNKNRRRPKSAGKITGAIAQGKKNTRLIQDMKDKKSKVNIGQPKSKMRS